MDGPTAPHFQGAPDSTSSSPVSTPPNSPPGKSCDPTNDLSASRASLSKAAIDPAKKVVRKKKADALDANGDPKPPKEKKPRKPREPKDPSKPPRKRQKTADAAAPVAIAPLTQQLLPSSNVSTHSAAHQSTLPQDIKPKFLDAFQPLARPASSGTRYDPIRSQYTDSTPYTSPPTVTPSTRVATPARVPSSILSLLEPTPTPSRGPSSTPVVTNGNQNSTAKVVITERRQSITKPPVKVVTEKPLQKLPPKDVVSTAAAVPKPVRQKEALPLLPLGSGLLSKSAFGKSDSAPLKLAEVPNECIIIDVPKNQGTGSYVNFMKEVEQKYGFDVAYPRIAEHRRRMRAVAAAGAAIESGAGSADDMALDVSDVESNAEMGGMDDESGVNSEGKKKPRRARANQYDKNDDFIDDAELLWEEQALASKDGYFVWSGPLINEGDKPAVERADGTVKRGRGGRPRGGAARGGAEAASGRGTRGGGAAGRGSRGGGQPTVRKPRATKAEKARVEAEKLERERIEAGGGATAAAVVAVAS